jgi:hypothetical protein
VARLPQARRVRPSAPHGGIREGSGALNDKERGLLAAFEDDQRQYPAHMLHLIQDA